MIRVLCFLSALYLVGCAGGPTKPAHLDPNQVPLEPLQYEINLNDIEDDHFKVVLTVDDLGAANDIYQFAATAPGSYQVQDIGRYVREFRAYDQNNTVVPVTKLSTNQFQIERPQDVVRIEYEIAETWDTKVEENRIYRMCGTSLEKDHAMIVPHGVIGFPKGMQGRPLMIDLDYPDSWYVGTALDEVKPGVWAADNFDHAVDSPIIAGRLSYAGIKVGETRIDIYTYSATDKVTSDMILDEIYDMVLAAAEFMGGFPVDRYTFIMHFEDATVGAWEHSYSSNYVFREANYERILDKTLAEFTSHEIFHMVTPLHIHSDIITPFNFQDPTPSRHLWLYEGTTEWAANIMRLRAGLVDMDYYLEDLQDKLMKADYYGHDYSLVDLALESYTKEGRRRYGNIYAKGAVVAGLLDIRLLELSGGKRGLREVIHELAQDYGSHRPFNDKTFIKEFVKRTYPELKPFFENYIEGSEALPLAEYYEKLGILYEPEVKEHGVRVKHRFTLMENPSAEQLALREAWMTNHPTEGRHAGMLSGGGDKAAH